MCQRHKSENTAPASLLQPLPIPSTVWTHIYMDFIEGLPAFHRKEVILVIVDRLSIYSYFIALPHLYIACWPSHLGPSLQVAWATKKYS